jgi:hypothetical protein
MSQPTGCQIAVGVKLGAHDPHQPRIMGADGYIYLEPGWVASMRNNPLEVAVKALVRLPPASCTRRARQ